MRVCARGLCGQGWEWCANDAKSQPFRVSGNDEKTDMQSRRKNGKERLGLGFRLWFCARPDAHLMLEEEWGGVGTPKSPLSGITTKERWAYIRVQSPPTWCIAFHKARNRKEQIVAKPSDSRGFESEIEGRDCDRSGYRNKSNGLQTIGRISELNWKGPSPVHSV